MKLHSNVCSSRSKLKGVLWDNEFVDEIQRISSHGDNINIIGFPTRHAGFSFFWGHPDISKIAPGYVAECGFWKNAWHLDAKGLWCNSQLNDANEAIKNYIPPTKNILNLVKDNKKYSPRTWDCVNHYDKWKYVVLITQLSRDMSVGIVGGKEPYYEFIRKAAKYYGDRLLLKAHPEHSATDREETIEIIKGTGAKYGTMDNVDGCEFVLLYNSTISGELFVKGIPIVQYAKGYFHNLEAIHFTDGSVIAPKLRNTKAIGRKTAEFLLWKYCIRPFSGASDVENFTDMLLDFANSKEEFPLNEKYSYANYLKQKLN